MPSQRDVAVIVGSLRAGSYTRMVARALAEVATASLKLEIVEIGQLSFYNQDLDTDAPPADWAAFRRRVKAADAVLFATPEYNRSVPGVLKNAMDSIFLSYAFRNKPFAAVGYSVAQAAGARAVEHLMHIAIESEAAPLRNTVLIPNVANAFNEDGDPKDPGTEAAMQVLLEDVAWWSNALAPARAAGSLPPGTFRMRAYLAKAQAAAAAAAATKS